VWIPVTENELCHATSRFYRRNCELVPVFGKRFPMQLVTVLPANPDRESVALTVLAKANPFRA